jgi:hypothetical protein
VRLRPVTLTDAKRFVAEHHRHNQPPVGWQFGVGLSNGTDQLRGVAIAGRPVNINLADGETVEITRVCTVGDKNANSMMYAALCRAAKALGYQRAITYTLESESGESLRAAGFVPVARVKAGRHWSSQGRARYDATIWGDPILPAEDRIRWERTWGVLKEKEQAA